jgi:phenylalanyl-tRNA synthetase beta chain
MGGEDSEILDDTRDVILEAASWDRASIRHASSTFSLQSEAARRFGRGVDPELAELALNRAAAMTLELAGGQTAGGLVDVYPGRTETPVILLTPERVESMLGFAVPREQIESALRGLAFGVEAVGDTLRVQVPSHRRFDVAHPADLVEDVARVVGFEHVPSTVVGGRIPAPRADGDRGFADEVRARRALAAAGLQEVITYSLVGQDPREQVILNPDDASAAPVHVANPLSVQQSVLRSALLGSILATARANLRHHARIALFEISRTWRGPMGPLPDERRHVALLLTGPREQPGWSTPATPFDFFDVKGTVDALCAAFGVHPTYESAQTPHLHPGRSARVSLGGIPLGVLGQLHPTLAEELDFGDRTVQVAELDVEVLLAQRPGGMQAVTPPRFPPAERDIAVVLDEAVPHADVERVIRDAGGALLASVRLFDVYRGDPIPAGKRSMAFALRYQAPDRTLDDAEIDAAHARVEEALRATLGAQVRGRE